MCSTNAPHGCHLLFVINEIKKIDNELLHLHRRVDLPNGRYTLVPKGGDEGADEELQYVDVAPDLDQSPEGPKANLASEGKPRIINPVFQNYAIMI
jgi:hypothetical protein